MKSIIFLCMSSNRLQETFESEEVMKDEEGQSRTCQIMLDNIRSSSQENTVSSYIRFSFPSGSLEPQVTAGMFKDSFKKNL